MAEINCSGVLLLGTDALPNALLRGMTGFIAPALVLLAAHYVGPRFGVIHPSLEGLRTWGPILAIVLSGALALAFNRGRVLFAVISLAVAFAAYRLALQAGLHSFAQQTVLAAISLFVPLNLAALSVLRERGIFSHYGLRRAGTITLQALLVGWVVTQGYTQVTAGLYQPVTAWAVLDGLPVPQLALAMMVAGVLVTVAAGVIRRSAIDAGFAGALVAFSLGCNAVALPDHFNTYTAAAALILGIGVVHDTFRLAFRDELTGLPSRRALNERMMALGSGYTMAMLDVDHFKKFNDTHGHALGDQVLRMVAAKMQTVGGGGRAYRYGGEEFTILFPGKNAREAWPHLETLRKEIAAYRLGIRSTTRPRQQEAGMAQRRGLRAPESVSVTVSIGVADQSERKTTPAEVLLAADQALYRAKNKGRNTVSR